MVKNPCLLFTFMNGGLDSLIKVTGMGFLYEERGGRPVLGTILPMIFQSDCHFHFIYLLTSGVCVVKNDFHLHCNLLLSVH